MKVVDTVPVLIKLGIGIRLTGKLRVTSINVRSVFFICLINEMAGAMYCCMEINLKNVVLPEKRRE
jgi:hypothetical protein